MFLLPHSLDPFFVKRRVLKIFGKKGKGNRGYGKFFKCVTLRRDVSNKEGLENLLAQLCEHYMLLCYLLEGHNSITICKKPYRATLV